jgi:hypothetical protein
MSIPMNTVAGPVASPVIHHVVQGGIDIGSSRDVRHRLRGPGLSRGPTHMDRLHIAYRGSLQRQAALEVMTTRGYRWT